MSRRGMMAVFVVLALLLGGQAFSQTRLTVKTVCYVAEELKVLPIDKDHLLVTLDENGIQSADNPAFNNISCHFSTVTYVDKGVLHFRGYGVYTDKDGDMILTEYADNPAGGGRARVIGATGKFAGIQGTSDYTTEFPKAWPEGTGRLIARGDWNFTLKNPL